MSNPYDKVPYDPKTGKYYKHLLKYASEVGSVKFEVGDIDTIKVANVHEVSKVFKSEFEDLNEQIENLFKQILINDMIYQAEYNFEPIIGETYHLYEKENEKKFLSLIEPTQWDKKYIGSFKLKSDKRWVSTNDL